MIWTDEAIIKASPDAITFERAKDISSTRYWKDLQGNEQFIAGECQSSGNQRYKTLVELEKPAFYCSCRSEKNPCKHALALLLIYLKSSHLLNIVSEKPLWLQPLVEKREKQVQLSKEEQAKKDAQKAKTRDDRFKLMEKGVEELEIWLFDFIREGLGRPEVQTPSFWDDFAARMVDAKLGSIGRKIRLFKNIINRADWHERLLESLSELYLFVRAFKKIEDLPQSMQQELLNFAGVLPKKDELIQQKGIKDLWLVIGQTFGVEENLNFRRTWLFGAQSNQIALLLDFVWGRNPFPMEWNPGNVFNGELVFYPSAQPIRALVKSFEWSNSPFEGLKGFPNFEQFAMTYAEAISRSPWLVNFPVLLDSVIPVMEDKNLYLVDTQRKRIKVEHKSGDNWKILALSGGQTLAFFGEWDGRCFRPLSAISNGRIVKI